MRFALLSSILLYAVVYGALAESRFNLAAAAKTMIVQKGPENSNLVPIGLIMFPGANISPEQMMDLVRALTDAAANGGVSLSTAVVAFTANVPDPIEAPYRISKALDSLTNISNGTINRGNTFLAGYSLGGVVAASVMPTTGLSGMIYLAAGVTNQKTHADETLAKIQYPFVSIVGELDGLNRMTHSAYDYFGLQVLMSQCNNNKTQQLDLLAKKSIVVLPEVNHRSFSTNFTGRVGPFQDFPTSLDPMTAKQRIAAVAVDFILANTISDDAQMRLWNYYSGTGALLSGFQAAINYDRTQIGSSNLCGALQGTMCVSPAKAYIEINNTVVDDVVKFVGSHPYVSPRNTSSGIQNIILHSYSYVFDPSNVVNMPSLPQTPIEVACKMTTLYAPQPFPVPQDSVCRAWNSALWNSVTSRQLTYAQWDRFSKLGWNIVFEDDEIVSAGPLWLANVLNFDANVKLKTLTIQSAALVTGPNSIIYPNSHYCKLLSPEKIVEWVVGDALLAAQL